MVDYKEEAKELIQKFVPYAYCDTMFTDGSQQTEEAWENAKACALIHVEGIIKANPNDEQELSSIDYWQQIKKAIESV